MTNTNLLKAKLREHGYLQDDVAEYLSISVTAFNNKLNNKNEFKDTEIQKMITLLDIANNDIVPIFFADNVE